MKVYEDILIALGLTALVVLFICLAGGLLLPATIGVPPIIGALLIVGLVVGIILWVFKK